MTVIRISEHRCWRLVGPFAAATLAAVLLAGCGGNPEADTSATGPAAAPGGGAPSAGMTGPPAMGGPMMASGPMMPGGPMTGMPAMGGGMQGGGAQASAPTTAPPKNVPAPAHRADPFRPWWPFNVGPPTPPVLAQIAPVRIATRESSAPPSQPDVTVQVVPDRRVAGILTGNGVYALLEGPDGATVVKPGDTIGEYRVASINPDSVTLKAKVGSRVYTQVVPLTDVGSTTSRFSGRAPGMPGGPGMIGPGAGGMPTAPGGGRRGMRGGPGMGAVEEQ